MIKSYKYRIYPTNTQTNILNKNINSCRILYNAALEERKSYYRLFHKSLSYNKQSAELPETKEIFPEQSKTVYSQSYQNVLKRLDNAYKSFFERLKKRREQEAIEKANGIKEDKKKKKKKLGFPRFKSEDRYKSICFPQSNLNGNGVRLNSNNKLEIYGVPGEVKIKLHRSFEGNCKTVTIIRKADKYYVSLVCTDIPEEILPITENTVGIDLGIKTFVTLDNGKTYKHPKPYKTSKERLTYLNRKLSKKKFGSNNRKKFKKTLSKAHERVSNIREDFQHKLSKEIIDNNDKIIVEDLNIKSMLEAKNRKVKKSNISDAAWAVLLVN